MKAKKLLVCMLAAGVILPATAGNVFAVNSTGTTNVTYDNRNYIPDPENPDSATWAVTIPSAINFTDDNKDIDASVELVNINGGTTLPTGSITVQVASGNEYLLKKSGELNGLEYKLMYGDGDKIMSSADQAVGTLTSSTTKVKGHAVLINDKAPSRGTYIDTLTYTINHTN